ncbi:P-loop containing nucleoside triphosphate hydrolase protein [Zopfochytrium polystomum]|nr:P-loop containing nucleoside triphosphate hydrolase protein [Zopfochytrium polystomum]
MGDAGNDDDGMLLNFGDFPAAEARRTARPGIRAFMPDRKGVSWKQNVTEAKLLRKRAMKAANRSERRAQKKSASASASSSPATAAGSTNSPGPGQAGVQSSLSSLSAPNSTPAAKSPVAATKAAVAAKNAGESIANPATSSTAASGANRVKSVGRKAPKGPFVSSLFTSNPEVGSVSKGGNVFEDVNPKNRHLESILSPSSSFQDLRLHPAIIGHLASSMSVHTPSAIQRASLFHAVVRRHSKDVCLEARTGSGKTLAYLLPILQFLLQSEQQLATTGALGRSTGTIAMIIAPTRELAKQIHDVLESLLQYSHNASSKAGAENTASKSLKHWIVGGIVVGGDKKKSEKARLRKGATVLISTPGRLLDHLKTTKSFNVENLRWVVLDEADRLLDLGFENTIKDILKIIDERRDAAVKAGRRLRIDSWPSTRQVFLASATLQGSVLQLAESTLVDPIFLKDDRGSEDDNADNQEHALAIASDESEHFKVPDELKQKYALVPLKLRLVTLISLIRGLAAVPTREFKAIVFTSTCDIVDFLFVVLNKGLQPLVENGGEPPQEEMDVDKEDAKEETKSKDVIFDPDSFSFDSTFFERTSIIRLHGNMPQNLRTGAYSAFSKANRAVLFCTDVAARGLDLPDVTDVIQYDLPCEVRDYIHRIGRTARSGRQGNAVAMLLPSEESYVKVLEEKKLSLTQVDGKSLLRFLKGVAIQEDSPPTKRKLEKHKKSRSLEDTATDIHMNVERFIGSNPESLEMARAAFRSFVRAYASHGSAERHIFHVKNLHLGHLAKSFGLRETPTVTGVKGAPTKEKVKGSGTNTPRNGQKFVTLKRKAIEAEKKSATAEFDDGTSYMGKRRKK